MNSRSFGFPGKRSAIGFAQQPAARPYPAGAAAEALNYNDRTP
jgi:hypothetical protein